MNKNLRRGITIVTLAIFFVFPHNYLSVSAQTLDSIEIVERYPLELEDTTSGGEIISADIENGVYILANKTGDPNMIGVVVVEPLILFDTGSDGVPLARSGRTLVNVTTLNGPIQTGDSVTSSIIPGSGQKADPGTIRVLGFALEEFPKTTEEGIYKEEVGKEATQTETLIVNDKEVIAGKMLVDLIVGTSVASSNTGGAFRYETETRTAIQYLVAAAIALGSIFFAFHNFGSTLQHGILSIGRNPTAKTTIQTSLMLHIFLVLLISGGGIFLSLLILRIQLF